MDQQQSNVRDPAVGMPGVDRVIDEPRAHPAAAGDRSRSRGSAVRVADTELPVRNRVQWGPIVAGALISLGTLVLLTVLGVAIGASAFEPGTDLAAWGSGAGIYGGISALLALFIGGWVAAKSAAVEGSYAGMMNGLLAGLTTIVALIVATGLGVNNLLGFLGGNLANITTFAGDLVQTPGADPNAQADAFATVESGAWGTFFALVLALAAAAVGGVLGQNDRQDLVEGTG